MIRRIVVFLLVSGVCIGHACYAEALIVINEVLADPSTIWGDANRDGTISSTQDEFVELVNTDSEPVSLANWTLADAIRVRHVFGEGASISALGFFVVFGGGSLQGFADAAIASSGTLSLNNTGDTVSLRDAQINLIDVLVYGVEGNRDVSLTRFPDAIGEFVQHNSASQEPFSPGKTVDGRLSLPIHEDHPSAPEPSSLILLGFGAFSLAFLPTRD